MGYWLTQARQSGRPGSSGRITDNARRAGVVILYHRWRAGLISGALDATGNVPFDSGGMLENAHLREIAATQDALHSLAV